MGTCSMKMNVQGMLIDVEKTYTGKDMNIGNTLRMKTRVIIDKATKPWILTSHKICYSMSISHIL